MVVVLWTHHFIQYVTVSSWPAICILHLDPYVCLIPLVTTHKDIGGILVKHQATASQMLFTLHTKHPT